MFTNIRRRDHEFHDKSFYILHPWLINAPLQIARVFMRLVRKIHLSLSQDKELQKKWLNFVNCQNWAPTKYYVEGIDHFHDKFIKHGKRWCKLNWELHPIPTIHPCVYSHPSLFGTQKLRRRSPRKRALSKPNEF